LQDAAEISRNETRIWHYGTMPSRPGFFLHHSQQLPVLAQALGRSLLSGGKGDWLQAETILIPQTSLKRWL
jgi:hypothetical protein